jgi:SAM-dependent methyltransferase
MIDSTDAAMRRPFAIASPPAQRLSDLVTAFVSLQYRQCASGSSLYNEVVSHIHAMCACLDEAIADGIAESTLRATVAPARELHGESPLIWRMMNWPRGYPGDFETLDLLLKDAGQSAAASVADCCERYARNSSVAYQHRNKIAAQAERIRWACKTSATPNLLVIAAGAGQDIVAAADDLRRAKATVVVNDIDSDAIDECRARLLTIADSVTCVAGNALTRTKEFATRAPYDLVMCGGLLDYLPDRQAKRLLTKLYAAVAPGGRLYCSNMATGNPYRSWLEYFGNWVLIERSEDEIRSLCEVVGPHARVDIVRDPTGLALIVDIWRA